MENLRIMEDYPENQINPPYGSCIAWELHEREEPSPGQEKYFVKFYYKRVSFNLFIIILLILID